MLSNMGQRRSGRLIDRRSMLGAAALGGLGLAFACFSGEEDPKDIFPERMDADSPANRRLAAFPRVTEVPGAVVVERIWHENARRLAIVLRDAHPVPDMTPRQANVIAGVQRDHEQTVMHFMDHPDWRLDQVFAEGLSPQDAADFDRSLEARNQATTAVEGDRRMLAQRMQGLDRRAEGIAQLRGKLAQEVLDGELQMIDDERASIRGSLARLTVQERRLADLNEEIGGRQNQVHKALLYKRGLRIRSAGNAALDDRAVSMIGKGNRAPRDRRAFEALQLQREDHALASLAGDPGEFQFLVFGADHDYKAAIARYNPDHPDDAFSAVIITTAAVRRSLRLL